MQGNFYLWLVQKLFGNVWIPGIHVLAAMIFGMNMELYEKDYKSCSQSVFSLSAVWSALVRLGETMFYGLLPQIWEVLQPITLLENVWHLIRLLDRQVLGLGLAVCYLSIMSGSLQSGTVEKSRFNKYLHLELLWFPFNTKPVLAWWREWILDKEFGGHIVYPTIRNEITPKGYAN